MDGGYTHVSNMDLPAGYTYFAQFVFHDLTSGGPPRLDLRSLYGGGPGVARDLYDRRQPGLLRSGPTLGTVWVRDVPRDHGGRAVIADWRNDRTIMLSQIHAAFIQLHNLTLAAIPGPDRVAAFCEARTRVLDCYRSIVVNDLLPRLVGEARVRQAFEGTPTIGSQLSEPPLEFTLAIGRIGHALVKPRYHINDDVHAAVLRETHESGLLRDLRGQRLDGRTIVAWDHFFAIGSRIKMQRAAKLNTQICRPLFQLPGSGTTGIGARSIPFRTLAAAEQAKLPSGDAVACELGFTPLDADILWRELPYKGAEAPLWFYILREAEIEEQGRRLGQVGATLLIQVILDALGSNTAQYREEQTLPRHMTDAGTMLSELASGAMPTGLTH